MLFSRGARNAATAAVLLALAACGTDAPAPQSTATATPVRLYGTDGNMINTFGDEFEGQAGILAGMKGTTPRTPLSDDFKARLAALRPQLRDYTYAGESYDAVVISALAAQQAGTTDPAAIAAQINAVTTSGTECETVAACLRLARDGADLRYRGVSLRRGGFTDAGEPSTASYATLHFDTSDKLDDSKTEYVGAGDESATSTGKAPAGVRPPKDGQPLKIGGLLPKTGDLSLAYPPMEAGVALAVKEINAAGGVFGEDLEWIEGDDGTNPEVAKRTVARHIDEGVSVIIGAGASSISRAVLPDVVKAGVVLFSSSNTDAGLSTVDDKGLYFRTAPSDVLQGRALADVILRDGPQRITIVARDDSYGTGLQGNVKSELERAGFPPDKIQILTYAPPAASGDSLDFADGAAKIKANAPDGVLVIGFAESAEVIKALAKAGVTFRH